MGYAARNSDFGIFSNWKDADDNNSNNSNNNDDDNDSTITDCIGRDCYKVCKAGLKFR